MELLHIWKLSWKHLIIVSPSSTADGLQNHMQSAVLNTLLKLHCVYFEKTKTYLVCEHTLTKIYKDATQASNIYLQMAFFSKAKQIYQ